MFPSMRKTVLAAVLMLTLIPSVRAEEEGAEHLFLGNPSKAKKNKEQPDNFLVTRRQFALSYNNSKGTPGWVSWQLSDKWLSPARRTNPFASVIGGGGIETLRKASEGLRFQSRRMRPSRHSSGPASRGRPTMLECWSCRGSQRTPRGR